jgi:hypothetical protein
MRQPFGGVRFACFIGMVGVMWVIICFACYGLWKFMGF